MWFFYIKSGELIDADGVLLGIFHSGFGDAMNDPTRTHEKNVGPLPCGSYTRGPAFTHPDCGPITMKLTPKPWTRMFGRGHMLCHGANKTKDPRDDSHGCMVGGPTERAKWNASPDTDLEVVAERVVSKPLEPIKVEAQPVGPHGSKE
jgi:hypothetical protein